MKRLCWFLLVLLSLAGMAHAQSTVVSGQVTDGAGQSWNGGSFSFTFQPNPQFPGNYTWSGGPLPTTISGPLNGTGGYSVSIPSNSAITPIGSSWVLMVCSQATSPCFTTTTFTITGTTQTINVTPPAIAISLTNPPSSPVRAYSDSEISSALIGSYYYNLPLQNYRFCQAVTIQVCTLWNSFGAGPPPTGFPRLDQVLNQNVGKTFNQGGAAIGFTAGPGLNLSGETSPLTVPVIVSCTTAAAGQICDDGTNYHVFVNGIDMLLAFNSTSIGSGNDGDVVGYKVTAGQVSLQDLAPVDTSSGDSFIKINNTSPLDGDLSCWNAFGPPFWVNCTPGAVDTSVNGATNAYTISFSDQLTTIDHDVAGSASVTVTLPTATTLTLNPGFVFVWSNHSSHADSIVPTTWTINGGSSLGVATNTVCRTRVDPNSTTNWLSDCASTTGSSGNLSGTLTAGKVPVASGATTLVDSSTLDDNTNPARNDHGFDVNQLGRLQYWVPNNGSTGTVLNKMVCDDGSGNGIICNHTTSTTNDPLGAAKAGNGAAGPGTTGSTGVCNIGFCSVVMDNSATANHYAQQSTTVDGDLSDIGASVPTNGQPYWHIFTGNAGAGTTAIYRNMTPGELNSSSRGGSKGGSAPASVTLAGTNATGQIINSIYKATIAITDLAPVVGDDGLILVIDPAIAIHLTRFACGVQGTTSVITNMVKGGNSLIADQTCTAGSVETVTTSTFVNGSGQCGGTGSCAVAAHAPVTLHIGTVSGTPTALQIAVEFSVD